MNTTHKYRIRATSTAVRSGLVVAEGMEPSIAFSAPPEFKGQAGHWTPEHFFVAAVASLAHFPGWRLIPTLNSILLS
jgi:organic hydroperoxide reductase OsmC/OhrA